MQSLEVILPKANGLDQNEEFFILKSEEGEEKINFHDYERIYKTPGLYEEIFHNQLKCDSPTVIKEMLCKNIERDGSHTEDLKILDFGAGNGMVAEQLMEGSPELIVGVDIIEEAKEAAERDRADVYEDYFVGDLGQPKNGIADELSTYDLNTIVSVAALGFDHIPPKSFINAYNLISNGGWVAINLRDKFLTKEDESGFNETISWIEQGYMEVVDEKTYIHRMSVSGEPIHYTAIIGRKLSDIDSRIN